MDHFARRENIKLYSNRLKSELHPNVRSHLQKLLLEEERRLGADMEFLAELEKMIINLNALIETQEKFVATLNENGGRERLTLQGLRKARDLCPTYRKKNPTRCWNDAFTGSTLTGVAARLTSWAPNKPMDK